MTRIRVNTDDLKNKAKDFESAAEAFARAGDDIAAAAMAMPSYDGQLSGPARKAGYEIQNQAREMKTALTNDALYLQNAAKDFERVENQTINAINQNQEMLIIKMTGETPPVSIDLGTVVLDFVCIPESQINRDMGPGSEAAGTVFDIGGIILNILEALFAALMIPLASDEVAFWDWIYSVFASLLKGETFYGKISDDYPPMLVLGQDVLVSGAEFILPFLAKLVGAAATEGVGYVPAEILDYFTSLASVGYDVSRLSGDFPTLLTIGVYIDPVDGRVHFVFITNSEI
jgi:hypothetical protein